MLKISNKYKLTVSQEELTRLKGVVLNFKLPFGVDYLVYKYGWSKTFSEGAIREYLRFAWLALVSDAMITPSEVVDEVWHCHILHTREYESFSAVCGRKLHHAPGMPNEKHLFVNHYLSTHELYQQLLGEKPPLSYWPVSSQPAASPAAPSFEKVWQLMLKINPASARC